LLVPIEKENSINKPTSFLEIANKK
jgi:hypothetical protein